MVAALSRSRRRRVAVWLLRAGDVNPQVQPVLLIHERRLIDKPNVDDVLPIGDLTMLMHRGRYNHEDQGNTEHGTHLENLTHVSLLG